MKPRPAVRPQLAGLRSYEAPEDGRANAVRLDLNENTAGCSPAVRRALGRIPARQIAMYPEYGRISTKLAKFFGVAPEELILTNGADDALRVFFDAFVETRSAVVFCNPSFPMYRYYAELFGARIVAPRYSPGIQFPLSEVLRALSRKPRLAIFANPNNPTGDLLSSATLRRIIAASPRTAVVIDEAYFEFSKTSVAPWIRRYPNLFVVRTFSKAAGLAALRLGAILGNSETASLLRRAMPPFGINLAALVAAEASLRDRGSVRRYVRDVTSLRESFAEDLKRRGFRVFPSVGNFILVDFGEFGAAIFRRLESRKILIRPRGDIGPGYARISIGTPAEMALLLAEIDRFLKRTRS
ncbi:MAG TPA: histidinol-phosphate transaminase [Candidatus Acidoferrales bacterium]|nr:histidinol-phosphate transaminase [Candidatus Acidoferrales bacterium]